MKRSWIGFGILLFLLLISVLTWWTMARLQQPIARELAQAAAFCQEGDWEKALPLAEQAQIRWEHNRHLIACVADHTPMEEIDTLFAQLEAYGQAREQADFAATCRGLAKKAEAIRDAHGLTAWNFL